MGRQPKAVHYRAQDSFRLPLPPPSGDSRLTAWPVQGTLTKVQKIWGNWALPALRSRRGGLPHLTPERTIFFSMAQSKFAPVQKNFLPKVDLKHDFGQQGFANTTKRIGRSQPSAVRCCRNTDDRSRRKAAAVVQGEPGRLSKGSLPLPPR